MEIIVIMFAAAAAVLIGVHVARHRRWQRAALRLGLRFDQGGFLGKPLIAGTMDGFKVLVTLVPAARAGAHEYPHRSHDTLVRITFPSPLQADVHFSPARSREGTKAAVGLRVIATGEDAFDDVVLSRGRSEVGVRRFLTRTRRRALVRFFGECRGPRYIDANVIVSQERDCLREEAIVAAVRDLTQVARCLVHSREEAAPERTDPDPEGAAAAETPAPAPAATVREPAAEETAPAAAPEEAVSAAAPGAAEPACADDASATCAALFDPKLSTYDTRRVFERDYRGKEIAWQGTLAAVERSSYDPELGEESGIKATFEIGVIASALGDSERVQAAVRFAPEEAAALESRRGARVTFRGTLAGVDGVSRTVYVGDGRLSG